MWTDLVFLSFTSRLHTQTHTHVWESQSKSQKKKNQFNAQYPWPRKQYWNIINFVFLSSSFFWEVFAFEIFSKEKKKFVYWNANVQFYCCAAIHFLFFYFFLLLLWHEWVDNENSTQIATFNEWIHEALYSNKKKQFFFSWMERREKGRENNKDELFRIRIVTLRLASAITDNKKLYTTTLFKLNYFSFLKWGNDCQKEYFTGIHRHFNKITWLTTIKRIVFFSISGDVLIQIQIRQLIMTHRKP